jgi:alpha-galactosidase
MNLQKKPDNQEIQKQLQGVFPPGVYTNASENIWMLVTERSTYALGVAREGYVVNLHWGGRLATLADLPVAEFVPTQFSHDTTLSDALEEYPAFGGLRYGEIAAQAEFADGVRDLDLRYERFEIETPVLPEQLPGLTLHLRDTVYPLVVMLRYQVDRVNDVITRSATLTNEGTEPIRLERAFSAAWHLPLGYSPRVLTTLAGQWAAETQIQRRSVVAGTALIESRRGITSTNAMPWFALESEAGSASSPTEVYFGALAWSGNWLMRVTTDVNGRTSFTGGISDHDFAWWLKGGEGFTTPDFVAGFADDGLNGARHRLHRHTLECVLPHPQVDEPRPVLYNSWEATLFNVHEAGQIELAERAVKLGVELFVVDDGWFLRRSLDNAGLGDWRPDPDKFPQGLGPLIERVNELGMRFGLWVEPEMVNPDSELYRAHPDWVYAFPTRARSELRNQLVLNLGREDVYSYLLKTLDGLLTQYNIAYFKWDMNRAISEPGWTECLASGGEAREVWVRHTQAVYTLIDTLRSRHPHLTIEACASGGGRADLGILHRTDQIWTSDNTHPEARLFIQEGFSLALPARVMGAWVTDGDRARFPLAYRFHVAMLGALGIGGHLLRWSGSELDEAARWIAIYKELRPLIQNGEQTWLLSPSVTRGALAAVQYTALDRGEAALFAFSRPRALGEPLPLLRLCDLDPAAMYTVEQVRAFDPEDGEGYAPVTCSGAALMARGLSLPLQERFAYVSTSVSCLLHIRRVSQLLGI